MYILQLIEIRCITLVSNVTRNGREIDVEKASCFAPGNSVRRSISIGSPTKRLREWNGDDEKGNEETDGEYNRTTEWDKKWYRQQKREKEKEWKRKRERFTVTLVLLCTCMHNHVHCPVYGATRYPLSPSALGCPWRPVLSQHPLPPSVTRSLQIRNLQHNHDDMSPPVDNFLSYVKKVQKIIFYLSRVYYDPHSTIKIRVMLKLEKLQDKCIETINFVELSPEN